MAFAAVGGVVLGLWRGILQPVDRGGLWWIVGDDGTSLMCSIRSMRKAVGSVRVLSIIITSEQQAQQTNKASPRRKTTGKNPSWTGRGDLSISLDDPR
jgi:hypothetical protein